MLSDSIPSTAAAFYLVRKLVSFNNDECYISENEDEEL
jgi:hypothetical protein